MNLNNPFCAYPGGWPLTGYQDTAYNKELKRLYHSLQQQDTKEKTLFHLTIGSPIEEVPLRELEQKRLEHQKYQMIPEHLWDAAKKGIKVIDFIISPNKLEPPMIIKNNDFKKIDNRTYVHNIYPLYVYVFYTMMPSNDKKRIETKLESLIQNDIQKNYPALDINTLYQTDYDVSFIVDFYQTLNRTITEYIENGSFCSCFTFAVFNQNTVYHRYNRCALFKELLKYYPETKNSILQEWVYDFNICNVYPLQSLNKSIICYVPPNEFKYNMESMLEVKMLRIDMINNRLSGSYISFTNHINTLTYTNNIIDVLTKQEHIYNNITDCKCEVNKINNTDIHNPLTCICNSCKTHRLRTNKYKINCNELYRTKCINHHIECINHPYTQNYIYDTVFVDDRVDNCLLDFIYSKHMNSN